MITVYPIGTTIYDPDKCYGGYTLIDFLGEPETMLIDMNGNVVHRWSPPGKRGISNYIHILENGNLLGPKEWDWDGEAVWEPSVVGHGGGLTKRLQNGNTLYSYREDVPDEYKRKIINPGRTHAPPSSIQSNAVIEVTPSGETVWDWHTHEHVDVNRHLDVDGSLENWSHFNTLNPLPENRWYDAGDERFRPGNLLISPRTLGFIFIVDKETKEIVWEYSGDYRGGLAGQHDPQMITKGMPGEGNIVLFDNGHPPIRWIEHAGRTSVLEIDPVAEEVVWKYEDDGYLTGEDPGYEGDSWGYNGHKFYSAYTGNVQRLPNGNTLINEAIGGRAFEVTREKELVWEYVWERHRNTQTANRYAYDHCPQLAALGQPEEKRVIPPPHVRTFYKPSGTPEVEEKERRKREEIYTDRFRATISRH